MNSVHGIVYAAVTELVPFRCDTHALCPLLQGTVVRLMSLNVALKPVCHAEVRHPSNACLVTIDRAGRASDFM